MNAPELRLRIDLHDLAAKLGMRRSTARNGNYFAPWRDEKRPSLSIFTGQDGAPRWKDHTTSDSGDAVDLAARVKGMTPADAMRFLHGLYGFAMERTTTPQPSTPETTQQFIWRKAKSSPDLKQAAEYLIDHRKLPADQVAKWQGKAFGYSDYIPKDGDASGFGPAIVFPVTAPGGGLTAINQRYLADGHEPKMRMTGEAAGGFFCPEPGFLRAPVLWLVESPIDALTLAAAGLPAIAYLSASLAKSFPLSWLTDKQRLMILGDADQAGKTAACTLYHRAISGGITVQMVEWPKEFKDPNEALQKGKTLEEIHAWAKTANPNLFPAGQPWLPVEEFKRLSSYACELDTMYCLKRKDDDLDEGTLVKDPVAGFRVYRFDPITIHDPTTALGGSGGFSSHRKLVHYRRSDSPLLLQKVIDQEEAGISTTWTKFGPVHNPRALPLMLQILGRGMEHHQEAVGVVGLVRVGKEIRLQDARAAFLSEENCIYHGLRFPSAPMDKAQPLVEKLGKLFHDELALLWFAWIAGSMMKVFCGFWPHLAVSGHSGSGKTLAIQVMTTLSGCLCKEPTELGTSFRRMKVLSNHTVPVVFDEISRAKQDDLKEFINSMNSSYRHQLRAHGARSVPFLIAAPVCMVGQDNPITDAAINTKLIAFEIDGKKNPAGLFTPDSPFPMVEWAEWLRDRWDQDKVMQRLGVVRDSLRQRLDVAKGDSGVDRFLDNYAALWIAVEELLLFSGVSDQELYERPVFRSLVEVMNQHLVESAVVRRESVEILDRLAREITLTRREDAPPYKVEYNRLIMSPKVMLDFLVKRNHFFPVTSPARLTNHLKHDGFLVEKSGRRVNKVMQKVVILDLKKMTEAGIDWPFDATGEVEE